MKKYNLLIPLAGKGQRMIDGGYTFPKPLILAGDRHVIDYALDSVDYSECNLIFVVRRDQVHNFAIDQVLTNKYGDDIQIIVSESETAGSVSSCYLAKDLINNDLPLIILCPDIFFEPKFVPTDEIFKYEGFILTFKANSTNYSYVCLDESGNVTKTAEKIVISDNASVGVYCFKTGKLFISLAELAQTTGATFGKEFYICPLYNLLIAGGGTVKTTQVPVMYVMGTPDEMKFFKKIIFPYFLDRGFILCADHSGYDLKENLKKVLKSKDINHIDCGCYSPGDCDYSDYVSQAVDARKYYPGYIILACCRSGQGVNITANKHKGIRSVLVNTAAAASLGIRHNAANFVAFSAGSTDSKEIEAIVDALMIEKFEGGRHQNRLQKVNIYED